MHLPVNFLFDWFDFFLLACFFLLSCFFFACLVLLGAKRGATADSGACGAGDDVGATVTGAASGSCGAGDGVGAAVIGAAAGACGAGGRVGAAVVGTSVRDGA